MATLSASSSDSSSETETETSSMSETNSRRKDSNVSIDSHISQGSEYDENIRTGDAVDYGRKYFFDKLYGRISEFTVKKTTKGFVYDFRNFKSIFNIFLLISLLS